jgi:hypothetical protein
MLNNGDFPIRPERRRTFYDVHERVNGEWARPTSKYTESANTSNGRPTTRRTPSLNTPNFGGPGPFSAMTLRNHRMQSVSEAGSKRSFSEEDNFVEQVLDRLSLSDTSNQSRSREVSVEPGAMACRKLSHLGPITHRAQIALNAVHAMQRIQSEAIERQELHDIYLRRAAGAKAIRRHRTDDGW